MILKLVPRDHVDQLPVPKRIKEYLKTPNYYSENEAIEEAEESTELSREMAAVMMPIPETEIVSQNQDVVVVEPAEENTNVMYLASSLQNVEAVAVPTSIVQGDRGVDGGVLGAVGAGGAVGVGGEEDQQQERVTPM